VNYSSFSYRALTWVMRVFSKIHWQRTAAVFNRGLYYRAHESDHDFLRRVMKEDYFIILTRRKSHLSTHLVSLASWLLGKGWSHYSHALMNVEGDISNNVDYRFVEATAKGVHWSTFGQVFDCDSICLLKPIHYSTEAWTKALDAVKASIGLQYDNLFDITNHERVSCVELVYLALQRLPDYEKLFPHLVSLLENVDQLTPQMLYECPDLERIFEVRR